jgi:AcrR family transcriptional regulator
LAPSSLGAPVLGMARAGALTLAVRARFRYLEVFGHKGRRAVVERGGGGGSAPRERTDQDAELPRIGRRERNKQEKLARIVGAARQLFGAKGFAETTTQEIAERADIGTGTLFLYAKSKEDLLVMVFRDEMIETSLAAFSNMPRTTSLVDQLMHVFGMMISYHDRDTELARILLKEIVFPASPERREDIPTLMRVVYGGIADLVVAGQKAGRLRADVNPHLAAEVLFGVYYLSLIDWLGGYMSKAELIDRLRAKLAIAVDGMVDRQTKA